MIEVLAEGVCCPWFRNQSGRKMHLKTISKLKKSELKIKGAFRRLYLRN